MANETMLVVGRSFPLGLQVYMYIYSMRAERNTALGIWYPISVSQAKCQSQRELSGMYSCLYALQRCLTARKSGPPVYNVYDC